MSGPQGALQAAASRARRWVPPASLALAQEDSIWSTMGAQQRRCDSLQGPRRAPGTGFSLTLNKAGANRPTGGLGHAQGANLQNSSAQVAAYERAAAHRRLCNAQREEARLQAAQERVQQQMLDLQEEAARVAAERQALLTEVASLARLVERAARGIEVASSSSSSYQQQMAEKLEALGQRLERAAARADLLPDDQHQEDVAVLAAGQPVCMGHEWNAPAGRLNLKSSGGSTH